jgi:hypothetical protein
MVSCFVCALFFGIIECDPTWRSVFGTEIRGWLSTVSGKCSTVVLLNKTSCVQFVPGCLSNDWWLMTDDWWLKFTIFGPIKWHLFMIASRQQANDILVRNQTFPFFEEIQPVFLWLLEFNSLISSWIHSIISLHDSSHRTQNSSLLSFFLNVLKVLHSPQAELKKEAAKNLNL